jgi:hypothetical protein
MRIPLIMLLVLLAAHERSLCSLYSHLTFSDTAYAQTAAQMIEQKFSPPATYVHSLRLFNTSSESLLYQWNKKTTPLIQTSNAGEQQLFTIDQHPWKSSGKVFVPPNPAMSSFAFFGYPDLNQNFENYVLSSAPVARQIFSMDDLQITGKQPKLLSPLQAYLVTPQILFSKDVNTGTVTIASQQLNGSCLLDWTILIYEGFLLENLPNISGLTHLLYYCIDLAVDLSSAEITIDRVILVGWTDKKDKFSGTCSNPCPACTSTEYTCDNFSANLDLSYISGDDLIKKNVSDKFNYSLDPAQQQCVNQMLSGNAA